MPRYIDADRFEVYLKDKMQQGLVSWRSVETALSLLKYAPTADVVQVVRCKDCVHRYYGSPSDDGLYCGHYPYKELFCRVEPNDFCSYGERCEK